MASGNVKWKSSVLNTFDDPCHCSVCTFLSGDRKHATLMAVIRVLDERLHQNEKCVDALFSVMGGLVNERNSK